MARTIDPTKRFEGEPCKKCGGTARYNKSGACCACVAKASAASRAKKKANEGGATAVVAAAPAKRGRKPKAAPAQIPMAA